MTEDEAKTKWCPMVQHVENAAIGASLNRPASSASANCIGSECMAWRTNSYELKPDKSKVVHGFCGLAGAER